MADYAQLAVSLAALPDGGGAALSQLLDACPAPSAGLPLAPHAGAGSAPPPGAAAAAGGAAGAAPPPSRAARAALVAVFRYLARAVPGPGADRVAAIAPGGWRRSSRLRARRRRRALGRARPPPPPPPAATGLRTTSRRWRWRRLAGTGCRR
jgi:hypothetical protein